MRLFWYLLLLTSLNVHGLTLLKRELFNEGATNAAAVLHSGALGSLDAVSNQVQCVAYGATTNGSLPWSGLLQRTNGIAYFTNNTQVNTGMVCGWFRFSQFSVDNTDAARPDDYNNGATFLALGTTSHGIRITVRVGGQGSLFFNDFSNPATNIGSIPRNTWEFIAVAWTNAVSTAGFRVYRTTNMTLIHSAASATIFSVINGIYFGGGQVTGGTSPFNNQWSGRMSGVSFYQLNSGAFADVAYPLDLTAPTQSPNIFYCNPATGSDTNDGRSAAAPWGNNSRRILDSLRYGWVSGGSNEWRYITNGADIASLDDTNFAIGLANGSIGGAGDLLLLNTDAAPLLVTNQLRLLNQANGVTLGSYGSGRARFCVAKQLTGLTNNLVSPNVWQVPDTDDQSVVWEDWKWMNSPTGANWAAVSNSVNSTPGSFFTDGSLIYIHPFAGTTNGIELWRSQKLWSHTSSSRDWNSTIYLVGGGVCLSNINVYGLSIRSPTNGGNVGVYQLQLANTNRTGVIDSHFAHGGNHCHGSVHGDLTNFVAVHIRSVYGHGPPTNWTEQGFSTMVEHCGSSGTDRRVIMWGCNWDTNGVIGSSAGTNYGGTWFSHNNITGTNLYTLVWMSNCVGKIVMALGTEYMVADGGWIIEDGSHWQITPGPSKPSIRRCFIGDHIRTGMKGGFISDSIIQFGGDPIGATYYLSNDWVFLRCTLDGRQIAAGTTIGSGLLTSAGLLYMTNCIVIGPATNEVLVVTLTGAGTITAKGNIYFGTNTMAGATNGSIYHDPRLNYTTYKPLGDSRARDLGGAIGPEQDFTGFRFPNRNDAGAVEYRRQQFRPFKR